MARRAHRRQGGVAELLRGAYGIELLPAEIEILPDERGAPIVVAPGLEGLAELPLVSLTHADGHAAALAALAPADAPAAASASTSSRSSRAPRASRRRH